SPHAPLGLEFCGYQKVVDNNTKDIAPGEPYILWTQALNYTPLPMNGAKIFYGVQPTLPAQLVGTTIGVPALQPGATLLPFTFFGADPAHGPYPQDVVGVHGTFQTDHHAVQNIALDLDPT